MDPSGSSTASSPETAQRTPSTTGKVRGGALGVAPVADGHMAPLGELADRRGRRRARVAGVVEHGAAASPTSRGGPPASAGGRSRPWPPVSDEPKLSSTATRREQAPAAGP